MNVRSIARRLADGLVQRLPGERLPSYWNGRWLSFPRASWESVRRNYEPYIARVLRTYLRPGGCFVDVGAYVGWWSVFAAAQVGTSGRVLALEPSPAYALLCSNAEVYPQITALRAGAGARTGSATFFSQGVSANSSFVSAVTDLGRHHLPDTPIDARSVPISTLDELAAVHHRQPSLIKIDVEGFEASVLDGATHLLAAGTPCVIEIHPSRLELSGQSAEVVHAQLMTHGYAIDVIDRNPNGLYTIVAVRP